MVASALFLYGGEHGFHDGYRHAEELLSLSRPSYQRKGQAVEKDKQAKSLYPAFCQRAAKWVRTGRQNVLNLYTNKTYYSEVFIE